MWTLGQDKNLAGAGLGGQLLRQQRAQQLQHIGLRGRGSGASERLQYGVEVFRVDALWLTTGALSEVN